MYEVLSAPDVDEQVAALPRTALLAYAEILSVLELEPRSGRPYTDELPDGPMRQYVFGSHAQGLVTYLVLDREREVHLLQVDLIGDTPTPV